MDLAREHSSVRISRQQGGHCRWQVAARGHRIWRLANICNAVTCPPVLPHDRFSRRGLTASQVHTTNSLCSWDVWQYSGAVELGFYGLLIASHLTKARLNPCQPKHIVSVDKHKMRGKQSDCFPTAFPLLSHCFPTAFPLLSYAFLCFPTAFPLLSYAFLCFHTAFLCFPTAFLCFPTAFLSFPLEKHNTDTMFCG
jgi:hypothetical protein